MFLRIFCNRFQHVAIKRKSIFLIIVWYRFGAPNSTLCNISYSRYAGYHDLRNSFLLVAFSIFWIDEQQNHGHTIWVHVTIFLIRQIIDIRVQLQIWPFNPSSKVHGKNICKPFIFMRILSYFSWRDSLWVKLSFLLYGSWFQSHYVVTYQIQKKEIIKLRQILKILNLECTCTYFSP